MVRSTGIDLYLTLLFTFDPISSLDREEVFRPLFYFLQQAQPLPRFHHAPGIMGGGTLELVSLSKCSADDLVYFHGDGSLPGHNIGVETVGIHV